MYRVALIGSGCWGSAIAKIVGRNVAAYPDKFQQEVLMYVYEEIYEGRKLTDIVNTDHENTKYLPDIKLPDNIVAVPDVVKVSTNADILIFVLPHQFVYDTCLKMKHVVKKTALAVSLIKGFIINQGSSSGIQLVTKMIEQTLNIQTSVLMGANLATEVASELFCETTIAIDDKTYDETLRKLFETRWFRCKLVRHVEAIEICGALKNVIGIGGGIIDGMGYGDNTKAAVMRLGLMEMIKFTKSFMKHLGLAVPADNSIFLESGCIGDLCTGIHGGRNRLLGEAIVKSIRKRGQPGGDIKMLEREILRGQSFQGPVIAKEVYDFLEETQQLSEYPLLVTIHKICNRECDPRQFLICLQDHPEHRFPPSQVPTPFTVDARLT